MAHAAALPRRPHSPLILAMLTAVGIAFFLGFVALGAWQVQRLSWKLDLIERVDQRLKAPPQPLPPPVQWPEVTAAAYEYQPVRLQGQWLAGTGPQGGGTLRLDEAHLDPFVGRLARAGLAGIEVHRPEHSPDQFAAYGALARKYDLIPSGGSDYHRKTSPHHPGATGDPPLPEDTVERLLAAALG